MPNCKQHKEASKRTNNKNNAIAERFQTRDELLNNIRNFFSQQVYPIAIRGPKREKYVSLVVIGEANIEIGVMYLSNIVKRKFLHVSLIVRLIFIERYKMIVLRYLKK